MKTTCQEKNLSLNMTITMTRMHVTLILFTPQLESNPFLAALPCLQGKY